MQRSVDEADTEGAVRRTKFPFCDRLAKQSVLLVLESARWAMRRRLSSVILAENSEVNGTMSCCWTLVKAAVRRVDGLAFFDGGGGGLAAMVVKHLGAGGGGGGGRRG